MANTALGYIDELIRYLDSGKRLFNIVSIDDSDNLEWIKPNKHLAGDLATSPKFTLPTLGQFYRPLSDLEERANGKFSMYVEPYEFDMLQVLPFESFALEFKGYDDRVNIVYKTQDVIFDKYILLCHAVEGGVAFKPFYYCSQPFDMIPSGWSTMGIEYALPFKLPKERIRHPHGYGYALQFNIVHQHMVSPILDKMLATLASTMWPEIRALLQFLVVLNVRKGITKTESKTTRSKIPTLAGRNTGYVYRVLDIDPDYVAPERSELGGTHASPRFHLRRAHLRHFTDGSMTLVRQARVGNPFLGIVEKDYRVKPKE